jgi:hypothetical protein
MGIHVIYLTNYKPRTDRFRQGNESLSAQEIVHTAQYSVQQTAIEKKTGIDLPHPATLLSCQNPGTVSGIFDFVMLHVEAEGKSNSWPEVPSTHPHTPESEPLSHPGLLFFHRRRKLRDDCFPSHPIPLEKSSQLP